jgi:hypothetical protein
MRLPLYCSTIFAGMKCTVLHTINRKAADSPKFVAPLKDATGPMGRRHGVATWRTLEGT